MRRRVVLTNSDVFVDIFQDCTAIMIEIAVVWRAENRDDRGELFGARFPIHLVPAQAIKKEKDEVQVYGNVRIIKDNHPCC